MQDSNVLIYTIYLVVYILIMMGIGLYYATKSKSIDDYLVAGRSQGFWTITGTIVATTCGAAAFIGFVGLGYTSGISGIFFWIIPAVFFGLLLAIFFSRVLWKAGLYTFPDAFALRFGKNAALIPTIIQTFLYAIPLLAIQFIGIGTIFATFFGINMQIGIIFGFLVVSVYMLFGGMRAVISTDVIQSVILTIGLFLLFGLGLHYAGGIETVVRNTPAEYWNPLGKSSISDFLYLALTIGPFYLVWQSWWQRIFAAKDEAIARKGLVSGFLIAGFILCFSFLIGIIARGYLPQNLRPDLVFTESIFTVFSPAVGGFILIGLAAALMSGADSYIMSGAAAVTRNIYQQYLHPDATDRQMLKASRLSVLLISVIGLVSALFAKGIIPFLILFTKIVGAGLVFPFLALMFWRRATQKGVTAGMITGVLVTVGWNIAGNPFVIQAVPGYLSSLVATIVVSLLTSHSADEQVEALYFNTTYSKEHIK